jgi:hypothetical protein
MAIGVAREIDRYRHARMKVVDVDGFYWKVRSP